MLKTGKPISEGQPFRRRLLSEYIAEYTLDNYVLYYDLKKLVKEAEYLRLECESYQKKCIEDASKNIESPGRISCCSVCHSPTAEGYTEVHIPWPSPAEVATAREGSLFSFPPTPPAPSLVAVRAMQERFLHDPALASLRARREKVQERFFLALEESYRKVKSFVVGLETKIMLQMVELHKLTEVKLREALPPDFIPRIYLQLECVRRYREVNLLAFRKILQKFLHRVACDRLGLQRRVRDVDAVISRSNVSLPTLDLRGIALELIGVYGTVHRVDHEAAVRGLGQFVRRSGVVRPRILPSGRAVFAAAISPLAPAGGFALRTLAGTRSRLTGKMLAELLRCGERDGPEKRGGGGGSSQWCDNGEIQVQLPGPLRGDDVFVLQSLASEEAEGRCHADAVMELLLLLHAVRLAAAAHVTAVLPYLAYTRNVASIAALAELIEVAGCHHVVTVDLMNAQVEGMFSIPLENLSPRSEFVRYLVDELREEGHDFTNLTVVAADGHHVGRAKDFADDLMAAAGLDGEAALVPVCTAVRWMAKKETAVEPPRGGPKDDPDEAPSTRGIAAALRRQARGRRAVILTETENPGREGLRLVGDVRGRFCIVLTTVLNEAVETANLARCLHENGAQRIVIVATHAVLAGGYRERLLAAPIEKIIVTDTIPQDDVLRDPLLAEKFRVLPIAPLLARAIEKIHTDNNLGTLFEK
ncbi:unnamed protein product [Phytomonas sp. Hart1]|nr:unnamed protein product [Phytomonas sp. Hart1]|eukprot:CCW68504.1 unnamed protein product [Phytomonas sp. isolate Hart1]